MSIPHSLPVLYSFRRCPYAIRARMALRYAGISVETREIALRQKPAALLVISPKATVPVLQLPGGLVIDQSLDIMTWALGQCDPDGWLTTGEPGDAMRWIALNDGPFKALLDRYKYPDRYPELSMAEHRDRALDAFIHPLDERLCAAPQVLGPRISIADVAIFPFVRQFALVDKPWFDSQPLQGVQTWLNAWLASELFDLVMEKTGVWLEAGEAVPVSV
jgi:glutathione S-transferase